MTLIAIEQIAAKIWPSVMVQAPANRVMTPSARGIGDPLWWRVFSCMVVSSSC